MYKGLRDVKKSDSRFRFDGLELRHVVWGDVALHLGRFTPGEPPIALKQNHFD